MLKKIEWNMAAFREIRTEMARGAVMDAAAGIAAQAGEGFEVDGYATGGKGRWRAIVYPATHQARARNARDNVLVRAAG